MNWVKPLQIVLAVGCIWVPDIEGFHAPRPVGHSVSTGVKDGQLGLVDLQVLLKAQLQYQADFQETHYSSFLTEPVVTSGTLTFNPPSRIEKHVMVPFEEIYIVEDNQVRFENPAKGISRMFLLDEYPSLQGILVGFRSALTGDFQTLKRFFYITVEGTQRQWTLRLLPLEDSISDLLFAITITGRNGNLETIDIRESNGDHSFMIIDKGKH